MYGRGNLTAEHVHRQEPPSGKQSLKHEARTRYSHNSQHHKFTILQYTHGHGLPVLVLCEHVSSGSEQIIRLNNI